MSMWKKNWVKVIFAVLIIWVIFVGYYYVQHRIMIWQYTINQEMDLKDVKVKIEEVILENNNGRFYKYNNELLLLRLKGRIITNKSLSNSDANVMRKNIDIEVIDEVGANHSSGGRCQYEDGSNIVSFEVRGNLFPIDRINNELTIIVKDKMNNFSDEIKVKPEYNKKTHRFFSRNLMGMFILSLASLCLGFGGVLLTGEKLIIQTLIERLIPISGVWIFFALIIKEDGWKFEMVIMIIAFILLIYLFTRGKSTVFNIDEENILLLLQEICVDKGIEFDTRTFSVKMSNGERKEIDINSTAMITEINFKRIQDKKLRSEIVNEIKLRLDGMEKKKFSYTGLFYMGMGVIWIWVIHKANIFG
ncbi:hypothetical protein [Crassaminicella profunda]|uniref:hypothetical protein n=1 Tax=Crassaminicella profunda TaxID=1286698 RepID=UPI001CA64E05|nr:hypothetical protein [Crassaminicella profunda]QZY54384.1 hypothetical protein K7H06_15245 [Crassaminicella profunda]